MISNPNGHSPKCLRRKCKVYGVITDINLELTPPQYEFETWFEKG